MEHDDDRKLRELLREWQVRGAPASLDERVRQWRRPFWRFLLTGSIRIPVPIGLAIAVMLLLMAVALIRQRPAREAAAASVDLVSFQPVKDLNVRVLRGHEAN